jgi:hypothetical protein
MTATRKGCNCIARSIKEFFVAPRATYEEFTLMPLNVKIYQFGKDPKIFKIVLKK